MSCKCLKTTPPCPKKFSALEADYIVVGLGAAGATTFRMLCDAGYSVIGVEGGGNYDDDPLIFDSTNAPELEESYTWKFFYNQETEPNESLDGRTMNYTTGRMLGGGSSINGMQYVRSTSQYWTDWAAINGSQWDSSVVTEAYKNLEKFRGVPGFYNPNVHGFDGKMQIRQAPTAATPMASKFAQALATATGHSVIDDYNDPSTPLGTFTRWSLFQKASGNRASSSNDFLSDFISPNGESGIYTNATVNKILFNGSTAVGVEIIDSGTTKTIKAVKEIIICAGIHSCEILQRSGIGQPDYLASLGIPVVYDNPFVGIGSKNHLINIAIFTTDITDGPGVPESDPSALYVGGAFLPNPSGFADPLIRGIQWIGVSSAPGILVVVFYSLLPYSVGVDKIQNSDPFKVSAVSENLFSDPRDLETIINVYQQQIVALDTEFQTNYPGYALLSPPLSIINDTAALTEYIISSVDHAHHWTGTCTMAPFENGGVVDGEGRVYGVSNLRVADISVAPIQPNGNTAGPAFLVGYTIAKNIMSS